ncbi:MAG: nucleotide exchange factor GrpE [Bacillota bacterium]
MNWKFWAKEKKGKNESALEQLCEQITRLSTQVSGCSEQVAEVGAQVQKVARLQYKTGQSLQGKLEELAAAVENLQNWQAAHDADAARSDRQEQQINHLTQSIIDWLDDIDLVCARLQGEGQELWRQLMEQWAGQLVTALQEMGIRELDLLGRSFDPKWADAIGTVHRGSVAAEIRDGGNSRAGVQYEVAEIAKRGFVYNSGQLLRKAQVITYEEEF